LEAKLSWTGATFDKISSLTLFRIGELSLLKNMMETMEVLGVDPQDEVEEDGTAKQEHAGSASTEPRSSASKVSQSTQNPSGRKGTYASITAGPQSPSVNPTDKAQKKRKGLTPAQKEQLEKVQAEQEAVRKERVAGLSQKLLDKISVWAETDRSAQVTDAFKRKLQVQFPLTPLSYSTKLRF
jgi:hypothetical protein